MAAKKKISEAENRSIAEKIEVYTPAISKKPHVVGHEDFGSPSNVFVASEVSNK